MGSQNDVSLSINHQTFSSGNRVQWCCDKRAALLTSKWIKCQLSPVTQPKSWETPTNTLLPQMCFDSCLINTVYIWMKFQFDLKACNPTLTVSLEWYLYRLFCSEINTFFFLFPLLLYGQFLCSIRERRSPEDDRLCAVCRLLPCSSCGAGSDSWSGSVCSSDPGSGLTGCCCPPAACCAPGWVWMKSAAPSGPAPAPTPAPVWTQGAAQSPSYCLHSMDTFDMERNLTCGSDAWEGTLVTSTFL